MHNLEKESIYLYGERGHVGWRLECRLECTELFLIIKLAFKKAPSISIYAIIYFPRPLLQMDLFRNGQSSMGLVLQLSQALFTRCRGLGKSSQ